MKQQIDGLELQPSKGGCFEVTVNDQLIYSKLETGEFPDDADIVEKVQGRVAFAGRLISGQLGRETLQLNEVRSGTRATTGFRC